jgi:hypothetical protein
MLSVFVIIYNTRVPHRYQSPPCHTACNAASLRATSERSQQTASNTTYRAAHIFTSRLDMYSSTTTTVVTRFTVHGAALLALFTLRIPSARPF